MRPDEKELLVAIAAIPANIPYDPKNWRSHITVRTVCNNFHDSGKMCHKRCCYLLKKWCNKDWFEFGVSLDLGWLTSKGRIVAERLAQENEGYNQ